MKKVDALFISGIVLLFLPFFVNESVYKFYMEFNHDYSILASFIKFAFLATLGEVIGLRIKSGSYYKPGFGVIPRMIVWGFLGITIKIAMMIFSTETPILLQTLGVSDITSAMAGGFSLKKLLVAFCISLSMNVLFAPLMMTFHRITDMHITQTGGTLKGFFTPFHFRKLFVNLDWNIQWNFVIKKTIPLFWIPAHTITFMLPVDFQVLFAALLGIALGTILAIADLMGDSEIELKECKVQKDDF